MKSIAAILAFVGVCGSLILAAPFDTDAPISPNLKLVATVDGKSFFAEQSTMNWYAAGDFCAGLGMKLAEITSKAQFDALNAAYSSSDFRNAHWIAGRDAHLIRQFSWNSTGDAISSDYIDVSPWPNWSPITYQTCLFYFIRADNASQVYFLPCERPDLLVLCST